MITTTKFFHYVSNLRVFCTEISTLEAGGMVGQGAPTFHQIYPDAADLGLTLVSHKTGREVDYVINDVTRNAEGEIESWELVPTTHALRRTPEARGTRILIYND